MIPNPCAKHSNAYLPVEMAVRAARSTWSCDVDRLKSCVPFHFARGTNSVKGERPASSGDEPKKWAQGVADV